MYAQDYGEILPAHYYYLFPANTNTRYFGFYDALGPYTNNTQVYICPSSSYTTTSWRLGLPNAEGFYGEKMTASYGVVVHHSHFTNAGFGTGMWSYNGYGLELSLLTAPAEKILICEMGGHLGGNPDNIGFNTDGTPMVMDAAGAVGTMRYRHNGMMNAAYADGHVKSIPQLKTYVPLMR